MPHTHHTHNHIPRHTHHTGMYTLHTHATHMHTHARIIPYTHIYLIHHTTHTHPTYIPLTSCHTKYTEHIHHMPKLTPVHMTQLLQYTTSYLHTPHTCTHTHHYIHTYHTAHTHAHITRYPPTLKAFTSSLVAVFKKPIQGLPSGT